METAAARLWTQEGLDALAYLTGPARGLSVETIRMARLGWTSSVFLRKTDDRSFESRGWVIPWFVGPRLALVKVRQPDGRSPKYVEAFRDPTRLACYPGPATVRPGRPLVVVEGEFDAIVLGEALGDLASVVTLGGASNAPTPAILARLLAATPWYIAMDNDNAGGLAAAKWEGYGRARFVRLPPRYKDWTEAKADGMNLRRYWSDLFSGRTFHRDARGDMTPELFTDDEAATWRWGSWIEDESLDN